MRHHIYEDDDGNTVQEFDAEAILYFIEGLEQLLDTEPGYMLFTPSVATDEQGIPDTVQNFILKRIEDE